MMVRQIFGEFEASELVTGGDSPDHTGSLKIREMAIRRTSRDVRNCASDVRDAHRIAELCQEFHDGLATAGVTLINSLKMHLHEFVKIYC